MAALTGGRRNVAVTPIPFAPCGRVLPAEDTRTPVLPPSAWSHFLIDHDAFPVPVRFKGTEQLAFLLLR